MSNGRPYPLSEETRRYPSCCTSAFCGAEFCDGCAELPHLQAFNAWKERTAAVQPDPIWDRGRWVATKPYNKEKDG